MPKACELCVLTRSTRWYVEASIPFPFVILDCDSCNVPMAVLGEHRAIVEPWEKAVMKQALERIAREIFPEGWFLDDHMRQIPAHYHLHARPLLPWSRNRGGY